MHDYERNFPVMQEIAFEISASAQWNQLVTSTAILTGPARSINVATDNSKEPEVSAGIRVSSTIIQNVRLRLCLPDKGHPFLIRTII